MEYEVEITLTVDADDATQATIRAARVVLDGLDATGWDGTEVRGVAALPPVEDRLSALWN